MAIDELLDEHEQGERVREWIRRNAAGIGGGVILGLALVGGWKWWDARQYQQRIQAGETYQTALEKIGAGDIEQAGTLAAELGQGSTYAALAALDLARAQVDAGKPDAAIGTLRGIGDVDPALQDVVDQRLARLLVDSGKHQDALQLLSGAETATSLEISGDAQAALGNTEAARKSYRDALTQLDVASPQRRLLEIKLTDLGGTPAKPEART